jgi:hypothetical protein
MRATILSTNNGTTGMTFKIIFIEQGSAVPKIVNNGLIVPL